MQWLIDTVLNAGGLAAREPLGLLQEGSISVAVKIALLRANCTLREGSPRTTEDWLISGDPGSPTARLVDRIADGATKSDIRIEAPVRLAIELKVFGEIGSKDSFNRGEIKDSNQKDKNANSFLWDLKAVQDRRAHAAIFVCGARQYDTARGERWDPRGRDAGTTLEDLFPQRTNLRSEIQSFTRVWRDAQWEARGLVVDAPVIVEYAKNGVQRRRAEARVVMALRLMPAPQTDGASHRILV
jgi:hypothetical protein